MGINLISPSATPSAVLIYDTGSISGGPVDSVAQMTKVGNVTVNAALEIQSTTGSVLFPRMTTTQKNALPTVTDGMQLFDLTLGKMQFREGGTWVTPSNSGGGIFIAAVGSAAAPSYTFTANLNTGMYSSAANTIDFSTSGSREFQIKPSGVSVNYVSVSGSTTGLPVTLQAEGADVNISLNLVSKGTGNVTIPGEAGFVGALRLMNELSTHGTTLSGRLGQATDPTFVLPDVGVSTAITTNVNDSVAVNCSPTAVANVFQLSVGNVGATIFKTVTITAANIDAMFGAAVLVIPAPGANLGIFIENVVYSTNFVSTDPTAGGSIYLAYGSTGAGTVWACTPTASSLLTGGQDRVAAQIGITGNVANEATTPNVSNKGVYITNDTSAFTGGDSTMTIFIKYKILPLPV